MSARHSYRHSPAELEYVASYSTRRQPLVTLHTHFPFCRSYRAQVIPKRHSLRYTRVTPLFKGTRRENSTRDLSLNTIPLGRWVYINHHRLVRARSRHVFIFGVLISASYRWVLELTCHFPFAAVSHKCPTPRSLNPLDHLARAIVMAGTSLLMGTLYIGMG